MPQTEHAENYDDSNQITYLSHLSLLALDLQAW